VYFVELVFALSDFLNYFIVKPGRIPPTRSIFQNYLALTTEMMSISVRGKYPFLAKFPAYLNKKRLWIRTKRKRLRSDDFQKELEKNFLIRVGNPAIPVREGSL
jgi:hypothetical protein